MTRVVIVQISKEFSNFCVIQPLNLQIRSQTSLIWTNCWTNIIPKCLIENSRIKNDESARLRAFSYYVTYDLRDLGLTQVIDDVHEVRKATIVEPPSKTNRLVVINSS